MTTMQTLTETDVAMLDLERSWFKYQGRKEEHVRERFGISLTRYYLRLNALIDQPTALAHDPMLVKRLLRLRAQRQHQRSAARLGFEV